MMTMSRPRTWSFQNSISFTNTLDFINNEAHQPCSYPKLLVNLSLVGFHQGSKPFFFSWRIIALWWCVGFCCITTRICHNFIYIYIYPFPESLPPHFRFIPLGHHRAPGWAPRVTQQLSTSYLFYTRECHICQCHFLTSPYPLFPRLCPHVCSLCLYLHSFPESRFISTIFIFLFLFLNLFLLVGG